MQVLVNIGAKLSEKDSSNISKIKMSGDPFAPKNCKQPITNTQREYFVLFVLDCRRGQS